MSEIPPKRLKHMSDDDGKNTVEPAKPEIWSVIWTEYTDDYKARGNDWSDTTGPYFFSTRDLAERFLCHKFCQILDDTKGSWAGDLDGDRTAFDLVMDKDYSFVKKKYRHNFSKLESAIKVVNIGEFVPRRWKWSIDTPTLDEVVSDSDSGSEQGTDSKDDVK